MKLYLNRTGSCSIPSEQVSRVNLVLNVLENRIVSVCNNGITAFFEFFNVIDDKRAEERGSFGQSRLINDRRGSFRLDALHDSLDGRLSEVVGIGFHCQAEHTDDERTFLFRIPHAVCRIVTGFFQYAVGNEVLASTI